MIRYFGSRGEDLQRAFPQYQRRFPEFQETFPDEGDVNMIRAIRTTRRSGYDGADAGPRARDPGRQRRGAGLRLRLWIHAGADSDGESGSLSFLPATWPNWKKPATWKSRRSSRVKHR